VPRHQSLKQTNALLAVGYIVHDRPSNATKLVSPNPRTVDIKWPVIQPI